MVCLLYRRAHPDQLASKVAPTYALHDILPDIDEALQVIVCIHDHLHYHFIHTVIVLKTVHNLQCLVSDYCVAQSVKSTILVENLDAICIHLQSNSLLT